MFSQAMEIVGKLLAYAIVGAVIAYVVYANSFTASPDFLRGVIGGYVLCLIVRWLWPPD